MKNSERNRYGKAFEKLKEIDKAIELYEMNVQLKCTIGFSHIRLIQIYKKKKDKINELRILKAYLPIIQQKVKDASSSLTRAERQLRLEDVILSIAKIKISND